jgi:hypothetical protein
MRAAVVEKNAAAFPRFVDLALQYWLEMFAGDPVFARTCFRRLLEEPLGPSETDWLVAVLVRAPDRECFAALDQKLRGPLRDPSLAGALWVAALVCGDRDAVQFWSEQFTVLNHVAAPDVPRLDFTSLSPRRAGSVPAVLNALVLPRETIFALYSRVTPGPAVTVSPSAR